MLQLRLSCLPRSSAWPSTGEGVFEESICTFTNHHVCKTAACYCFARCLDNFVHCALLLLLPLLLRFRAARFLQSRRAVWLCSVSVIDITASQDDALLPCPMHDSSSVTAMHRVDQFVVPYAPVIVYEERKLASTSSTTLLHYNLQHSHCCSGL